MTQRTIVDIPATPHFDFLFGFYNLSTWRVPYFATTMTVRHAAESLRLTVEFPGAEAIQWKLDELYQRDLDWPRVERKILPYLHAPDQPQFFNALTVALVPIKNGEMLSHFSTDYEWQPPPLETKRFAKIHSVGPIVCGYWDHWEHITDPQAGTGKLRWNPSEVFAVALDGQHRLAALKRFVESPGIPESTLAQTRVPIILLILDEELGYRPARGHELVDVLRRLFIDLNKHARTVSRARQILLDDKDPTSVCVRALVGEQMDHGTAELKAPLPRLPLSLVDWHTEQAKFDEGPYLTTTLGLDWMIASLLGARPIQDFTAYSAVGRQIQALERSLKISLSSARRRLDDLREVELRPFAYTDDEDGNELQRIADAFQHVWSPAIVELLTKLRPYEELLRVRGAEDTFSLEFVNWYVLKYRADKDPHAGRATDEYRRLLGRLQSRVRNPIGEPKLMDSLAKIENLKRDSLAFNVVFQRAYVLAFNEFQKIRPEHLEGLASDLSDLSVPELDEEGWDEEGDYEEPAVDDAPEPAVGSVDDEGEVGMPLEVRQHAEHLLERSKQFVRYVNAMIDADSDVLRVNCRFEDELGDSHRFWLGTLEKPDGGIDFTQGASRRASEILFWIGAMYLYDDVVEPHVRSEFDEFWAAVLEGETGLTQRVASSVRRFSSKENSAGGRILKTREAEFEKGDSREEARIRMEWLWHSLGL